MMLELKNGINRIVVIAAIGVVALAAAGAVAWAQLDTSSAPTSQVSESALSKAIQVRNDHSLRSDTDWVQKVEGDPSATRVWWGIALTADEQRSWETRAAKLEAAQNDFIPKVADEVGYGGVYLRYAPEDSIVVVDSGSAGRIDTVARQFTEAPVVVQPGKFSLKQLTEAQSRVDADTDMWRAQGIIIATSGPDVPSNRVRVGVVGVTAEQAQRLTGYYGDIVVVADAQPPRLWRATVASTARTRSREASRG